MRNSLASLAALAAMVACQGDSDSARQADSTDMVAAQPAPSPTLHGFGIGCLAIGAPIGSLVGDCAVVRDTIVMGIEGMLERQVTISVAGAELLATVVNDTIWRIAVETPEVRTEDSLGVGTTLARLMALPEVLTIEGEGGIFMVSDQHCGLSFELDATRSDVPGASSLDQVVRALDESTPVSRVLVVGCERN